MMKDPAKQSEIESEVYNTEKKSELNAVLTRLEEFSLKMEESKIAEYMTYLANPRRMIRVNLLMGMARGFGFAVGFGILSALAIYILQWVIRLNLPLISNFLIDILTQADYYIQLYR
jgi:hypothetical protein